MMKGGKILTEKLLKMEAALSLLFFHICIFILSFSKDEFIIHNDSAIIRTKYLIAILAFISIWIISIALFKDIKHKRDFTNRRSCEDIYKWLFEKNPNVIFLFNDTNVSAMNSMGERMVRDKKTFTNEKMGAQIIKEDIKEEKGSKKNINSYIKDSDIEKRSIEVLDKISHEIRTPLNILLGILHNSMDVVNTIEDNEAKKRLTKDFEIYDRNIKRIQKLSNSFIGLIEIQYKDTLYLQRCDLINIIRSLSEASLLHALKKEKSVEFFSEIDSKYGDVDVDKFEKMILNLISNAIKFSNPKSIIYIRVREEEEKLIIEICSSGKMIEEGQKKDIFQLFNQGEKLLTRSTEGLGLGLYFVKEYIQMHKGEIEVQSDYNGDTVFTVHLPIFNHKGLRQVDSAIEKDICKQKVEIEFSDL